MGNYQLERLYVTVTENGAKPTLQVLARTPGVTPPQLAECWRLAQLLPPPANQRTDAMPGSLGLFRGETAEYIIAKAQTGPNGVPQFQYLLAPSAAIRALGGNLESFVGYAKEPIPQFATQRSDLPPFVLDNPEPPDTETQTNDILALITYCKNDLKVVGGLLAGVVQAMGIGIINAPLSLEDRVRFVQGLLTLLPIPARVAITFATSVIDPAQTNSQIKFLASDMHPANHLMFDWAAGKLLNEPPDDVYAKFIMAQLRLDISLVVEQTDKLARTAVWRAMRKEDMANALAWASRRSSLDSLVLQNLPADRTTVAGVLREDPTLPDDLRIAYTRHLLNFSLALDDLAETDIIPTMANSNRELAENAYEQLRSAADGERAMAVYRLVSQWIANPPLGTDVSRWWPLLGIAALTENNRMLSKDHDTFIKFLTQFQDTPPELQMEPTIAQIIGISRKRAYDNPEVARHIFLLGVNYLPISGLQRLLGEALLVARLPEALRNAFPHLVEHRDKAAPPALLMLAAMAYGPAYEPVILARMVEWALFIHRFDLIDLDAVRGMIKVAVSPQASRFDNLIDHLIAILGQSEIVRNLDPKMPQTIVALNIASGRYANAIGYMEIYQQSLYRGTPQEDMSAFARAVFRDLPLPAQALNEALQAMQDSQLKPIARANAYLGALENKGWGAEMEAAARKLTSILFLDPRLTDLLGVDPVLRLLKTNADRRDAMEALRLASALVEYALSLAADRGPTLIQQVYPMIKWSPEVEETALEILRTYVRRASWQLAQNLPDIMGNKYGESVRKALNATHRLRLMAGISDLTPFAEQVNLGVQLLMDMALTYAPNRELPQTFQLRRTLEGMPGGGLSDKDRERLSKNLNTIGLQILRLNQIAIRRRSRTDPDVLRLQLLKGQVAPNSGIEALTWIGGHFAKGQVHPLTLEQEAPAFLFGSRSVNILLHETDLLVRLLNGLLAAFPEKDTTTLELLPWANEVESLWGLLTLYKQRQLERIFAEDMQTLSQLLGLIGEKGSEHTFQSGGHGKQLQTGKVQPRSTLDALRWVSGYFGRMHG
ncbi:MAG: hypothetical protein ABI947_16165 [Chloroflexota bacterium]